MIEISTCSLSPRQYVTCVACRVQRAGPCGKENPVRLSSRALLPVDESPATRSLSSVSTKCWKLPYKDSPEGVAQDGWHVILSACQSCPILQNPQGLWPLLDWTAAEMGLSIWAAFELEGPCSIVGNEDVMSLSPGRMKLDREESKKLKLV